MMMFLFDMTKQMRDIGLIVFLIIALIVGPLLTIWMLNTLFPALAIAYTFKTWLAAGFMNATIAYAGKGARDD
jgi:hypothetical protein